MFSTDVRRFLLDFGFFWWCLKGFGGFKRCLKVFGCF